jgi:hypothetical protein
VLWEWQGPSGRCSAVARMAAGYFGCGTAAVAVGDLGPSGGLVPCDGDMSTWGNVPRGLSPTYGCETGR